MELEDGGGMVVEAEVRERGGIDEETLQRVRDRGDGRRFVTFILAFQSREMNRAGAQLCNQPYRQYLPL